MVKIVKCALAAVLASLPAAALAAWELNMPVGVTELSRRIHALHMLILWVCVAIAVAVFGVMIYSIVKFRRSQGAVAATFDHSTRAEIVWTVIPIVILVAMAVPAAATLVRIEDTRNSDLTVKVTGFQWPRRAMPRRTAALRVRGARLGPGRPRPAHQRRTPWRPAPAPMHEPSPHPEARAST
jgi:cytochrome c oxidase subunit 2